MKIRRRTQITILTERSFAVANESGHAHDAQAGYVVSRPEPERNVLELEIKTGERLERLIMAHETDPQLSAKK